MGGEPTASKRAARIVRTRAPELPLAKLGACDPLAVGVAVVAGAAVAVGRRLNKSRCPSLARRRLEVTTFPPRRRPLTAPLPIHELVADIPARASIGKTALLWPPRPDGVVTRRLLPAAKSVVGPESGPTGHGHHAPRHREPLPWSCWSSYPHDTVLSRY